MSELHYCNPLALRLLFGDGSASLHEPPTAPCPSRRAVRSGVGAAECNGEPYWNTRMLGITREPPETLKQSKQAELERGLKGQNLSVSHHVPWSSPLISIHHVDLIALPVNNQLP